MNAKNTLPHSHGEEPASYAGEGVMGGGVTHTTRNKRGFDWDRIAVTGFIPVLEARSEDAPFPIQMGKCPHDSADEGVNRILLRLLTPPSTYDVDTSPSEWGGELPTGERLTRSTRSS